MKRNAAVASITLLCLMASMPAFPDDAQSVFSYTYIFLTENPEGSLKELRAMAPRTKGYVSYFSGDRIVLRIPSGEVANLKNRLSEMGYITDENQRRQDYSAVMLDLETRLGVKQKLLGDLSAIFSGTRLTETLKVEKEMGRVIVEIEDFKGKMSYYRDRFALADVTVHINRSASGSVGQVKQSGWGWIRNLGIGNLIRD